jgi:hypothetical protein
MTIALSMAVAFANSPMTRLGTQGRDDGCLVVLITPGGPAEKAGIQACDLLREMDVYSVREHRHLLYGPSEYYLHWARFGSHLQRFVFDQSHDFLCHLERTRTVFLNRLAGD